MEQMFVNTLSYCKCSYHHCNLFMAGLVPLLLIAMDIFSLFSLMSIFWIRSVDGRNCLSTQTDPGASKLRRLDQTLEAVECDLVDSVTYPDYSPYNGEEFDFIVVGAGSAGSVVASRLSENPSWRVLLLEAGGDPIITTEFPSLLGTLVGSSLDWNYTAEPDARYCLGSKNQRCSWPRGKVLGGSSTINWLAYLRGSPEVCDSWERDGSPGWGYTNLLPYFKKSEDLESKEVRENRNYKHYHGEDGNLTVDSFYPDGSFSSFFQNLSSGFKELGYGTFNDLNAQYQEGLFTYQGTIRDGRRCSTAKAFIKPAQLRANLKISKGSLVSKILLSQKKIAEGVVFDKDGAIITARARKEVIVSAGVVNSPQLLMLSGIGPRDHLKHIGIQVISDLPVGYNLQDHYALAGYVISVDANLPEPDEEEAFLKEVFESKATVSINGLGNAIGKIRTSQSSYPNIQLYFYFFTANSSDSLNLLYDNFKFNDIFKRSVAAINKKGSTLNVFHTLVRPKSKGRIMLRSSNSTDYPLIYPNYLDKEDDIDALLESVEFVNRLVKTNTFTHLGAKVERVDIPGCRPFAFQSEDYWKCMLQYSGSANYHPAGTCRMGPRGSSLSVVDPTLQVIGVRGLRVVDGSIMPTVPNCNINAPIIAIAEKASDLIKCRWKEMH